jgi:transcriptional regulator with XRE-family HTH domain
MARFLAREIRAERARAGLSQADLADRLGTSPSSVSAMERGVRQVLASELPDLCRALGVDLVTFLTRADASDRRAMGLP